jgi:flagellar FliL protein
MSKPAAAAEATDAAPAKKSNKKLFIILGAVVVLLAGGGAGAWFFTHNSHSGGEHDVKAEPPKAPVYLPLDTFTVNLQGGEQYLQTDITLQVADEAQIESIKLHMPRVRSRLLTLLSSKHAENLATADDKKKLAQEILAQMKQPFDPKGKPQQVVDVLFTTFVIQ